MSTQHTPAPWFVVETEHRLRIHGPYNQTRPSGVPLHKLEIWEPKTGAARGCSPTWKGFTEEQRADARLIAAAPELLAACQDALRQLKEYEGRIVDRTFLDSAIAKAEGHP